MTELFLSEALWGEIQRKIAYSSSTYLANDVYFKMGVIDLLINAFGKGKLKEMLIKSNFEIIRKIGKNFDVFMKKFYKIYSDSSIAKLSQDTLKDKELKNKDTHEYRRVLKNLKNVNVIRPEITALYVFLIENTSMKSMSIRREFYKILEHTSYKTIPDDERRKVGDATSQ